MEKVTTAYELTKNEDKRLAESIAQVITSANEELFEKMKEDKIMASALFELMKPEVEEYAEDRAKDIYLGQARIMLQHGSDDDYIKLLTHLTDAEIGELRKNMR